MNVFHSLAAVVLAWSSLGAAEAPRTLTVMGAISLRDALTDVAPAFEKANDVRVEFVFGASGQLAAQAKAGAPGDLFISAADKQVDDLIAANVADAASRTVVAGNALVLVVPANARETITRFEDLAKANRIAVGEPKSVPAGMYAAQVIAHFKLESDIAGKLVYGANVKQVADYVARGEADAGIIYATDASSLPGVKVVATAPADWHEPIRYPAIVLKHAAEPQLAKAFVDMLASEPGQSALAKRGFTTPTTQPAK